MNITKEVELNETFALIEQFAQFVCLLHNRRYLLKDIVIQVLEDPILLKAYKLYIDEVNTRKALEYFLLYDPHLVYSKSINLKFGINSKEIWEKNLP